MGDELTVLACNAPQYAADIPPSACMQQASVSPGVAADSGSAGPYVCDANADPGLGPVDSLAAKNSAAGPLICSGDLAAEAIASQPQAKLVCPPTLEKGATPPGFRAAVANEFFHCGFQVMVQDPWCGDAKTCGLQTECAYDEKGQLVTETHPYKDCRGTDDECDPRRDLKDLACHVFTDPGGVLQSGFGLGGPGFPNAFLESRRHDVDTIVNSVKTRINEAWAGLEADIRRLYGA